MAFRRAEEDYYDLKMNLNNKETPYPEIPLTGKGGHEYNDYEDSFTKAAFAST
jgi:hypothetical protein